MDYFSLFKIPLPDPLPDDEQIKYLQLAQAGDKVAMEKSVMHNLRLVLIVFNYFDMFLRYEKYEKDDVKSVGVVGLIKAINSYDFDKNTKFSTYAIIKIKSEIRMFLRQNKKLSNEESLFDPIFSDDNEITFFDKIEDNKINFEEEILNHILYEKINEIVDTLPDIDKEIFNLYYMEQYTEKKLAEKYNVSRAYISFRINKMVKYIGSVLKQLDYIGKVAKVNEDDINKNLKKYKRRKNYS